MGSPVTIENVCSADKVDRAFQPLVDASVRTYRRVLGDMLLNIRLLGSVARGTAIPHQSDIDLMTIISRPVSQAQLTRLASRATELWEQTSVVSKVDLDVVVRDDVSEAQRFIFSSDSLSLHGEDLYTVPRQVMDSDVLADLVTPNLGGIVASYKERVATVPEHDEHRLFEWSRWCGKDVLKCLRGRAIRRERVYEREIPRIYEQLLRRFPEHSDLIRDVFGLYDTPRPDTSRILNVLERVGSAFVSSDCHGREPAP